MNGYLTPDIKILILSFSLFILLLSQIPLIERSEGRAVKSELSSGDSKQNLCDAIAELRSSLRAASDESSVLSPPSQSVAIIVESLARATESLEDIRQVVRDMMGSC
jgi:hypothetical protein